MFRILPLYLIYRPANNIPYATLEEDLGEPLRPYCSREWGCAAAPEPSGSSEVRHKCQTFQHWLYLWTNGSFLVTDLAGVGAHAREGAHARVHEGVRRAGPGAWWPVGRALLFPLLCLSRSPRGVGWADAVLPAALMHAGLRQPGL